MNELTITELKEKLKKRSLELQEEWKKAAGRINQIETESLELKQLLARLQGAQKIISELLEENPIPDDFEEIKNQENTNE